MQTDGFVYDETVNYRLYRPSSGEIFNLEVAYDAGLDHSGRYHDFGMSAITKVKLTPVGIHDPAGSHIRIYPNPSHGVFNVEGISGSTYISVFDAFGNEVYNARINEDSRINLSGQPNGVLLVQIKTLNGISYQKLIIN